MRSDSSEWLRQTQNPYLGIGGENATRSRRERKGKTSRSAIRLRFVPALVEALISGLTFAPLRCGKKR